MVEIDVKNLIKNYVNCEEFCILQLLYNKQFDLLREYSQTFVGTFIEVMESLQVKGYILSPTENPSLIKFEELKLDKSKILELQGISKEDTAFYTFFSTYPQKVPARAGGTRSLRPANVDGKQAVALKKKYFTKVGEKEETQKHVQAVLEAELELRRKTNALQYLPAMEVYLNGYKWESYEYLLQEKQQIKNAEPKKGERLI